MSSLMMGPWVQQKSPPISRRRIRMEPKVISPWEEGGLRSKGGRDDGR